MNRYRLINNLYQTIYRPVAFLFEPEKIHDKKVKLGSWLMRYPFLLAPLNFEDKRLETTVQGLKFASPIGLAAGFDYDGYLADLFPYIGFGFNTVGTVTAQAYEGNRPPRLKRLVKSQSILVNKGFKSEGATAVAARLNKKFTPQTRLQHRPPNRPLGISVGSSNLPTINTVSQAIDDYCTTFEVFKNERYVNYFELNISCPNTALPEVFLTTKNFSQLLRAVKGLKIKQPIFIKMPNELTEHDGFNLMNIALKEGTNAFIFGNLVKDRNNPAFEQQEISELHNLKGHFSGRPTEQNVLAWLKLARQHYGKNIDLVGCGGTFNSQDALAKLRAGADLVQLITGLIYSGPALPGEIGYELAKIRTRT